MSKFSEKSPPEMKPEPEATRQFYPGSSVKRFIAGAVCPRCGEMDRIMVFIDHHQHQRKACVSCGFNEGLSEEQIPPPELETRVSKQRKPVPKSQPIKFYPRVPGKEN
jgi:uncharacterized protein